MNAVESPVLFRNSSCISKASLLKEIINNNQLDENAVAVFHDGKYFGINGTSAAPTSIARISVASSQQHQENQKAHAALTEEIKELFETSSCSNGSITRDRNLDASLSRFLTTHLNHLTKSSLVSFSQDEDYATNDQATSSSASSFQPDSAFPEDLPLAATYASLSPQQQQKLDEGKTVAVQNRTTDRELLQLTTRRLRGLMPTFTAYKLTEATSEAVADAFSTPINAANIFPHCEGSSEGVMSYPDDQTMISELNYQFKAAVLGFPKELEENIPFKATCRSHADKSYEVSFENTHETDNINKIKGCLHAVPHADRTLVSLDLFIDLKGMVLPRLLTEKAIRVATKLILRAAIKTAEK